MTKHYGTSNKGFTKANQNRTERAILKARSEGKSAKTDRKLAEMMDRLYGTDFVATFHA